MSTLFAWFILKTPHSTYCLQDRPLAFLDVRRYDTGNIFIRYFISNVFVIVVFPLLKMTGEDSLHLLLVTCTSVGVSCLCLSTHLSSFRDQMKEPIHPDTTKSRRIPTGKSGLGNPDERNRITRRISQTWLFIYDHACYTGWRRLQLRSTSPLRIDAKRRLECYDQEVLSKQI